MLLRRLHIFLPLLLTLAPAASCATLLVLPLENASQYHDLNWVGESAAETLSTELGAHEIVLDRAAREDGLRRLSLRTGAQFTKATLIKLGQTLGADYLCYGTYEIKLPASNGQLRDASLRLELRFLDLRKLQDGPAYSEAGKLTDLSRLEEHLAWQSLVYLEPQLKPSSDQFLQAQKLVTFDAKESYVRGLLTANPEQRERLFLQAIRLAPQYTRPIFELGSVALARKDYRQAIEYLKKIPATDSQHMDAQFKLGIAYFGASDYPSAVHSFSELAKEVPLSEVFNNLGAAESRLSQPVAIDDFRRAVEGAGNDPDYHFNLSFALLNNNHYDDAAKEAKIVLDRNPGDQEAQALLDRARARQPAIGGPNAKAVGSERLKPNLNATAFKELKAMLHSGN